MSDELLLQGPWPLKQSPMMAPIWVPFHTLSTAVLYTPIGSSIAHNPNCLYPHILSSHSDLQL